MTPTDTAAADKIDDPAPRFRARGSALALAGTVTAGVVAADVLTKQWVLADLTGREPLRTLGGLVYLNVIRNSGAAFSLGTGYTWVFGLVAVVVVGWICWLAVRLRSIPWAVALGLVLGGALGNLTDRVFRAPGFMVGHVVDFVSLFGPDGQYFAIFNLADAALSVGVVLLIALELSGRRRDGTRIGQQADRAHG